MPTRTTALPHPWPLRALAALTACASAAPAEFTEADAQAVPDIMTTIRQRHAEGWRMSHLHESFVPVG
ncbi:MAG: hypothetical protein KJZ47_12815 [Gemmatimonadales bacterium]|nr:hypothetical protein [Gemmatimonadales bacterium]